MDFIVDGLFRVFLSEVLSFMYNGIARVTPQCAATIKGRRRRIKDKLILCSQGHCGTPGGIFPCWESTGEDFIDLIRTSRSFPSVCPEIFTGHFILKEVQRPTGLISSNIYFNNDYNGTV